ncbi:MAG: DUF4838 domain-containing protein, partial [Clostridia bacterium]|nr:DUF4838 domain-containing protein [Clostridia bacterium]
CMCESCQKIYAEEGAYSGAMIRFVNAVAAEFAADYPELKFDTFAYHHTRSVCKTVPADNVVIRLCTIECCFSHPLGTCSDVYAMAGSTKTISEDIADWGKICDNIYIWDYTTNYVESVTFFPNFNVLLENAKFFADHNAIGVYEEGNFFAETCDFPELRAYTADTPDTAHPVPLAAGDTAPTYYLPMNMQTDGWDDITLTAPGCTVFLVADDDIPDKSDALAGGHRFRLLICGEHYYQEAYLVCTGLPLLKIDLYNERRGTLTDSTNIARSPASTMQFSYYDPCDPTTGTVASDICAGTIRVRGGTSAKYDKHSFKLSLYDDFTLTDHHNLALCGLRRDEDWVLNAMYQEETKVRDMLAYDLWEDIGADHYGDGSHIGTRMRYVEVILGGKYWGLYGLCEPEDAKQFGISAEEPGCVYKVGSWTVPSVEELRHAIRNELPTVAEVEVKYPEVTDESARDAWKPFLDYVEATYESTYFTFSQTIDQYVDENNLIDLWIHLNVISGRDNQWKNLYLACRASDGKLVMAPWDCDISFGLGWQEGDHESLHLFHEKAALYEFCELEVHDRYLKRNLNGFADRLAERWWELRGDWLCE